MPDTVANTVGNIKISVRQIEDIQSCWRNTVIVRKKLDAKFCSNVLIIGSIKRESSWIGIINKVLPNEMEYQLKAY